MGTYIIREVQDFLIERWRRKQMDHEPTLDDIYSSVITRLREQNRVLRCAIEEYAKAKTDFDDKRLQEDHHAWRERYTRLVGAETILIALTATSQPAKSAGKMHACDVPGCVSCGNPEDATSQERSVNKEG